MRLVGLLHVSIIVHTARDGHDDIVAEDHRSSEPGEVTKGALPVTRVSIGHGAASVCADTEWCAHECINFGSACPVGNLLKLFI